MTELKICIITCEKCYARLPDILKGVRDLAEHTKADVHMILIDDLSDIDELIFRKELWKQHISSIEHILKFNLMSESRSKASYEASNYCNLQIDQIGSFKPRKLRISEASLVKKHYEALKIAAMSSTPTLILEDDALIVDPVKLAALCTNITINGSYTDLCADYKLRSRGRSIRLIDSLGNLHSLYFHKTAQTRTTCSYVLGPKVAKQIVQSYWPCALPVDLHLQYLLLKHKVSGYWGTEILIEHLSKSGIVESMI